MAKMLSRLREVLDREGPIGVMHRAARKIARATVWCERVGFYETDLRGDSVGLRASRVPVKPCLAEPAELLSRYSATLNEKFGMDPQVIAERLALSHVAVVGLHEGEMIAMVWLAFNGQWVGEIGRTILLRPGECLTYNAVTLPGWRGLGISPYLSQFAGEIARQRGASRRINWRRLGNRPATRVAAKLGDRLFAVVTTVRLLGVEKPLVFGLKNTELLPLIQGSGRRLDRDL